MKTKDFEILAVKIATQEQRVSDAIKSGMRGAELVALLTNCENENEEWVEVLKGITNGSITIED
jgi:hypothetical protein